MGDTAKGTRRKRHHRFNWQIFIMAMAGVIFLLVFSYIPMFGIAIAFKDLDYSMNVMKDLMYKPWVGMSNFVKFVTDAQFGSVMYNTLMLGILELVITFPIPILFALLLNELRSSRFRKVVQTTTYFPCFISWVVFAGIVQMFVSSDGGFINDVLLHLGIISQPISFLSQPAYFYPIIIISSVIKGTGWGSVVYVSAIAGVDQEIYEAAHIDGANRRQTAFLVTLPCIMPTVMVMLLLAISGILNSGFDRIYMLQNPLNLLRSEVLDTYVYKVGIASDWLMIGVLTAFMLICLYPFWYVVAGSFNSGSDYMRGGVLFWPRCFSLENYQVVMVDSRLWIGFRVTIARTIVGTVFHLAFTSMVAYAMSRDDLPCRKGIYWYCMLTMFFGGGLIPFYLLLKTLGLLNSFWVYIIPGMFSVYNMIIISNYFRSVAEEIHESAVMDGASEFIIYSRLYLPLSKPVLATVTLWVGVGQWNSFFDTMVYTTDRNLQTLQLFLYKMIKTSEFTSKAEMGGLPAELVSNISTTTVRYATIVVSTIPILCIYPFLQRFLTKGIMLGSLKG